MNKPSLRQITKGLLATYNRRPREHLSQNFLINPEVLQRITKAAEISKDDLVIEIGTGLGVLTNELAEQAGFVVTVEIDGEFNQISKAVLKKHDNINFILADFLKLDLDKVIRENLGSFKNIKVVANVPYHITSPIIEKLIKYNKVHAENLIQLILLTIQKEVAERMASAPGSKVYGSLSVFVQYYNETKIHSLIPRFSFYPQPSVSSAILILKPYTLKPFVAADEDLLEQIVRSGFGNRRKQLRNTISKFGEKVNNAGIDLSRRPETLSIEEFVKIANTISEKEVLPF